MDRRRFLTLGTITFASLAGCSDGESTDGNGEADTGDTGGGNGEEAPAETDYPITENDGGTATPEPTDTPTATPASKPTIAGTVQSEHFTGVDVTGIIDDGANEMTVRATLENTSGGARIVSGMFYNHYDATGSKLNGHSKQFGSEKTVPAGDTFSYEHTLSFSTKNPVADVADFEAIDNSRDA